MIKNLDYFQILVHMRVIFCNIVLWILLWISVFFIVVKGVNGARFKEIRPFIVINDCTGIGLVCNYTLWIKNDMSSKSRNKFAMIYQFFGILMLMVLAMWGVFNPFS